MNNIIGVKLRGGLGNQMFEYACARSLQIKYKKCGILLDIDELQTDRNREFGLRHFILCKEAFVYTGNKYNNISRKNNSLIRLSMKTIPKVTYKILRHKNVFLWDCDEYINIKLDDLKDAYLYGYFQSIKYFNDVQEVIRRDFTFSEEIPRADKNLSFLLSKKNSVCVHMRFGDYLQKENSYLQICTPEYYNTAIKNMLKKFDMAKFFIFSDDINMAKHNINNELLSYCVFVSGKRNDFQDLQLMSMCNNFIISNSTFSWWAQYLSCSKDKTVVAPKKWKKNETSRDIYMDDWILL